MNNDNISIDSSKLELKINLLKEENKKMSEILENIKKSINNLPMYWESNTCDQTMNDFNSIYTEFKTIIESNNKYINFLEEIVSSDYQSKERTLNEVIDEKI